MALMYTPAHHIDIPDVFTDETTGQHYAVRHDTDAEDPRGWVEAEHAALWAFDEPGNGSSTIADKPEGNLAIDAFERFYEAGNANHSRTLDLTRRWLQAFYPEKQIQVETQTIRGYSQGDWFDVVAAVAEGYGTPQEHLNQLRQWVFGDVWIVIPDGKPGVSGIYADDVETAVTHYRENFEDTVFEHTITLKVTADDAEASLSKVEQIVQAIHKSDTLPFGVTVTSYSTAEEKN